MIKFSRTGVLKLASFFLLVLLSAPFVNTLKAQDYYGSSYSQRRVNLGLTFSPNVSWLRYGGNNKVDKKLEFGYSYGLQADFALAENYAFGTGFLINNLKSSAQLAPDAPINTYKIQYLEIPFGLKLKSTQRYYRSYFGQFGFTGGVKMSSERAIGNEESLDLGSDAKAFRLGLQIGGGVEWQLDHNLKMMTGLSFNNGLNEVFKEGGAKNSYLAFNFGIFF